MSLRPLRRTQKLTIIAKDPSVRIGGEILRARVDVPAEELSPGPRGYRVQVIDYDASSGLLYPALEHRTLENGDYNDPFAGEPDETLLGDPGFHAQNVYAIVMRTLARFEYALGRRVSWSFGGHQIQVSPHAFLEANAFYSKEDRALLFGYFPGREEEPEDVPPAGEEEGGAEGLQRGRRIKPRFRSMIFSCLAHDVVAHETTHALLDGLRPRYTDRSSPEQAGFHEGFADVIALLSIYSLEDVVRQIIDRADAGDGGGGDGAGPVLSSTVVSSQKLTRDALAGKSLLFSLGEEFGRGLADRNAPLRRSITLKPGADYTKTEEFVEPHRRGELLVAAMMNAFLEVWLRRIEDLYPKEGKEGPDTVPPGDKEHFLDRKRVVEEGAAIADQLLTMSIRAIDYCPPTDLQFCDFLSALLTADRELRPDDSRFKFRETLRSSFAGYGITPTSKGDGTEPGVWEPPDCSLSYDRVHLESMRHDRDEVFRFLWENRTALGLDRDAYTRVLSVRPAIRVNPDDGFVLEETVAEYHQILNVVASELKHLGIKKPKDMSPDRQVTLYGGGALVFDEFGRLKFHIRNRLLNPERQTQRLKYLWEYGEFEEQILEKEARRSNTFARMHLRRFGPQGGTSNDEFF
ncbi:MAG TPA: hypothetical protein VHC97_09955 [Thermoanaerobaculia bacterium]|jgi:hypothetical protein|nr:hypothetical protein [Thermoanaerobaculia bacterium]